MSPLAFSHFSNWLNDNINLWAIKYLVIPANMSWCTSRFSPSIFSVADRSESGEMIPSTWASLCDIIGKWPLCIYRLAARLTSIFVSHPTTIRVRPGMPGSIMLTLVMTILTLNIPLFIYLSSCLKTVTQVHISANSIFFEAGKKTVNQSSMFVFRTSEFKGRRIFPAGCESFPI